MFFKKNIICYFDITYFKHSYYFEGWMNNTFDNNYWKINNNIFVIDSEIIFLTFRLKLAVNKN